MIHTHRRLLALALIAAIVALPACKKAQDAAVEAAMEKATGMKVDKDGNAVTIKTEKGDLKVATAEDGGSVPLPASPRQRISARLVPAQCSVAPVSTRTAGRLPSLYSSPTVSRWQSAVTPAGTTSGVSA